MPFMRKSGKRGQEEAGMKAAKVIDNPGVTEISPEELYRRLRHQEEQLSERAFRWLQTQFANQRCKR